MTSDNVPAYLGVLAEHFETVGIERGKVVHVEIRHDDTCALWRGGVCDCEAVVENGARVDRKYSSGLR